VLIGHESSKNDNEQEEEQMEHGPATHMGSDKKKKRGRMREGRYINDDWWERGEVTLRISC
jgi:hypothetical protein